MKNFSLFIVGLLFSGLIQAQNFEGSVKWAIQIEITDTLLQKQVEANKARLNDPAVQERMKKEREQQMNDPQMKKMMETNPQMKTQFERMMAMQQSGSVSGLMFPTSLLIKLKDGNTVTLLEGGMINTEVLYLKDKNQTYRIDRQNKTFAQVPPPQPTTTTVEPTVTVTKTKEFKKILNYTCTKYIAEVTHQGKKMTQIFWTTTEIKGVDRKVLTSQRFERGRQMFYENVEGFPLRIEIDYTEMKTKLNMEVSEIKKANLKSEEFSIPADFKAQPPSPVISR